jgi:RimJ/RimL family protein N-acetyltransferase
VGARGSAPLEQTVELPAGVPWGLRPRSGTTSTEFSRATSRRPSAARGSTHAWGRKAFEIGYWIRASRSGEGLGTEATAALARVGIELCGAGRIEIRVDPENAASLAIPRKLGFTEEGRLRRVLHGADGTSHLRDAVVFALLADELAGTPVASVPLEAFDATGARVP